MEIAPDTASCGYTPAPDDPAGVINASAYRAFLLTKAGIEFSEPRYLEVAKRNLNFVLASQNADGSWYYSTDGARDFVDHFHTCFVLKALAKIEQLTAMSSHPRRHRARGQLLRQEFVRCAGSAAAIFQAAAADGLSPGTIRLRGVHQPGRSLGLAFLSSTRRLRMSLTELLERWQKPDGSFRARQLLLGWDNVPMHRWAQSQVFRSLCFFLAQNLKKLPRQDGEHFPSAHRVRRLQTRCNLCAEFADNLISEARHRFSAETSRR